MGLFRDLTGQRFGRLVVLRLDRERTDKTGNTYWICQCDCGKIKSICASSLVGGLTKSCGCIRRELLIEYNIQTKSKYNRYEFDENLGCYRGYFNNSDGYFLVDADDLDYIKDYCWFLDPTGYVVSHEKITHVTIRLSRFIMARYFNLDGLVVDHINHNIVDNRKFNLRVCPYYENAINARPYSNTGEKYIYYNKARKIYIVQIRIYGDREVGAFKTLEEAIIFRDNYILSHPNDFYYDPNNDYNNRVNLIHPFRFVNPNAPNYCPFFNVNYNVIRPFVDISNNEEIGSSISPFTIVEQNKFNNFMIV